MISNELLKKKILDEAIHGRLIENNLLLPPVDVEEIKEDIPFDVPNNWKWIRFGDLVKDCYQGINTAGDKVEFVEEDGVPIIQVGDMTSGIININNTKLMSYEDYDYYKDKYQPKYNDIFYCNIGTIGCPLIYRENYEMLFHWNIFIIKYNEKYSDVVFLKWCLEYYTDIFKKMTSGSAMKFVSKKKLLNTLFSVPPLEEQYKIANKIEELFELVDKKEKNDKEKEKLKTLLKEKLLDSAIHGELVENDLSLPIVDVEEIKEDIPFEIPNNWKWSNFEYITTKISDGAHSTPKYVDNGIPFLSVKDISDGNINFENCKYISEEQHKVLYSRCDPKYGDLLITKVGTTGVPVVVDTNIEFSLFVSVAMLRFDENKIYNKYIKYATLSKLIQSQIDENTRGAANKNWVIKDIKKTIIPIPPLEQQKKIVEKIEKCFELIEQL